MEMQSATKLYRYISKKSGKINDSFGLNLLGMEIRVQFQSKLHLKMS